MNYNNINEIDNNHIDQGWLKVLAPEKEKEYFKKLQSFLKKEETDNKIIYPDKKFRYAALCLPPAEIKIIILGQDPYHNPGQAHGLSFSVPPKIKAPPSLVNIFKEINQEHKKEHQFSNACLLPWFNQGVFLLNSFLTVEKNKPASHHNIGWETFTDQIIKYLSDNQQGLVFLLWGNFAKTKARLINENKHLILSSAHPSPFSAHNGFFGNNHFILANQYLLKNNKKPINWFF